MQRLCIQYTSVKYFYIKTSIFHIKEFCICRSFAHTYILLKWEIHFDDSGVKRNLFQPDCNFLKQKWVAGCQILRCCTGRRFSYVVRFDSSCSNPLQSHLLNLCHIIPLFLRFALNSPFLATDNAFMTVDNWTSLLCMAG